MAQDIARGARFITKMIEKDFYHYISLKKILEQEAPELANELVDREYNHPGLFTDPNPDIQIDENDKTITIITSSRYGDTESYTFPIEYLWATRYQLLAQKDEELRLAKQAGEDRRANRNANAIAKRKELYLELKKEFEP